MKHKSSELLSPPNPHELTVPAAPSTHAAGGPLSQRKKPHVLPPLNEKRRNSIEWRPRGSPPPMWRRSSLEDAQLNDEMEGDRPAVRVIRCPDPIPGSSPHCTTDNAVTISESPPKSTSGSSLRPTKYAPLEPIKPRRAP